jgi:hypothetical protein
MRPGMPRREMTGAAAECRRPTPGTRLEAEARGGLLDRVLTHHGPERPGRGGGPAPAPSWRPLSRATRAPPPMLDLKGLHRLGEFGRPTGDLHPIIEPEIPVGEPNHGDTHPVEVVGHDTDLLFHGAHPLSSERRPCQRPDRPSRWSAKAMQHGPGIRSAGIPASPEGQTGIRVDRVRLPTRDRRERRNEGDLGHGGLPRAPSGLVHHALLP